MFENKIHIEEKVIQEKKQEANYNPSAWHKANNRKETKGRKVYKQRIKLYKGMVRVPIYGTDDYWLKPKFEYRTVNHLR